MFEQILVPLDGSAIAEQALPAASALAQRLRVRLHLLACVPRTLETAAEILAYTEHAGRYLEEAAAPLRAAGLAIETRLVQGDDVPREIRAAAAAVPGTLVVMTTHGRSGVTRWLLGSVTERVLEGVVSAVLVVRAQDGAPLELAPRHILVPVDESALAEQALPTAAALARLFGADVVLAEALSAAVDFYLHPDGFGGAARDLAEIRAGQGADYLARQAAALRASGLAQVHTRLLHGAPAESLLDCLETLTPALVVMTSHGRSGLGRWLMGSVAGRVVRQARQPVLILPAATP